MCKHEGHPKTAVHPERAHQSPHGAHLANFLRSPDIRIITAWAPPTVADTKRLFLEKYTKPIPGIYSTVINELLVQQHLVRHSIKYRYDEVSPGRFLPKLWTGRGFSCCGGSWRVGNAARASMLVSTPTKGARQG